MLFLLSCGFTNTVIAIEASPVSCYTNLIVKKREGGNRNHEVIIEHFHVVVFVVLNGVPFVLSIHYIANPFCDCCVVDR